MAKEKAERSKFISRYAKHCLTIRPADYETKDKGKYAEFNENELVTSDPEVISFLRQHQEYNINIFEEQVKDEVTGGEK